MARRWILEQGPKVNTLMNARFMLFEAVDRARAQTQTRVLHRRGPNHRRVEFAGVLQTHAQNGPAMDPGEGLMEKIGSKTNAELIQFAIKKSLVSS